jgi:hypothetical protein
MFSSFSRRQLLRLISLTAAGTAVVGSVPVVGHFFASKAQGQETPEEEVYKGRKFRIVTNQTSRITATNPTFDTSVQLFLDDKQVRILHNKKRNKYITPHLFAEFNSPREVARQLIDLGLKFPSSEVQLDPNVD